MEARPEDKSLSRQHAIRWFIRTEKGEKEGHTEEAPRFEW